jgi:phage gpG-like protein
VADFLRIEVTGGAEIVAALVRAQMQLGRPTELMRALAARGEANVQERFDTKRDPDGVPWQPLASSTKALYDRLDTARRGPRAGQVVKRGTLLERTGQMRASLTSSSGTDYAEWGMSRLSNGGAWSIPLLHETGTRRMPRRGIFFGDPDAGTLGADDEATLAEEIDAFLDDAFRGFA